MTKKQTMFKYLLTLTLLCTTSQFIFGQHINIDKKALSFLNSQEKVNVEFIQDSLLMIDDLYEMESIQKMRSKITRQTTVDEANAWIKNYKKNKDETWPETFVNQLNEKLSEGKNVPLFEIDNAEALYTMSVMPTWIYFGYDAGIIDRPAKVTLQIHFYETKSPNTIIFSTEISRAMAKYNKKDGDGEGVGPSLNRMRKAFAMAGYKLAKSLKRVVN